MQLVFFDKAALVHMVDDSHRVTCALWQDRIEAGANFQRSLIFSNRPCDVPPEIADGFILPCIFSRQKKPKRLVEPIADRAGDRDMSIPRLRQSSARNVPLEVGPAKIRDRPEQSF